MGTASDRKVMRVKVRSVVLIIKCNRLTRRLVLFVLLLLQFWTVSTRSTFNAGLVAFGAAASNGGLNGRPEKLEDVSLGALL